MVPSPDEVDRWAAATGADAEQQVELVELAEAAATEAVVWRRRIRSGLAGLQQETGDIEATAGTIRAFHPVLMHGLLQAPGYARAVFEGAWPEGLPDLAKAVVARVNRQEILYQEGRHFTFLLSEAGLRWRFCPKDVLLAQLGHLVTVATLPAVTLGILPLDMPGPVWHSHGFTLFTDRADGA